MKKKAQSYTQTLVAEIEAYRRETGMSREAFAQDVVGAWSASGEPQIGRAWKTDGDVFEQAKVNAQRLYRWLDDVTKDNNLLPANVMHSILAALPESRRIRVLNAQLESFGLMAERIPSSDHIGALNEMLATDIKETSESHQALVMLAANPTPEAAAAAHKEMVESMAAHSATMALVEKIASKVSGKA